MIPNSILGLISEIAMPRSEGCSKLFIGAGIRILIPDEERDRRPGRLSFKDPGKKLHLIRFFPRRGSLPSSRRPSIQFFLNLFDRKIQPRRAAIDDHAQRQAVRLSPGSDLEKFSEGIPAQDASPFRC